MIEPEADRASKRLLRNPIARLVLPETVYAAALLIERINPARVAICLKPLLEQAHWEIRRGSVTEQTLEKLVTLQPARHTTERPCP